MTTYSTHLDHFANLASFLTVEGDAIILNREGLLQVDRLLHEFFLPEHKNARYA